MPYCYKHVSEDNPRGVYYDVLCPECAKAPKYVERDERHEGARKAGRKLRSNQWVAFVGRSDRVSIHNPKHENADPIESYKPEQHDDGSLNPDAYGGEVNFEPSVYDIGAKPKSLGRNDANGNRINCTPKQIGVNKNKAAKQKSVFLVNYDNEDCAIICEPSEHDEVYFSEYGLSQVKEAYQYVNEDMRTVINPRWKSYTRLTQFERDIIEANRGGQ